MNEQHDKVRRIKASYYQAHKPTQDPPENHWHDLAAVTVAILVLLILVFLASLVSPVR